MGMSAPKNEKLGKSVAWPRGQRLACPGVAQPPLGDRSLNAVNERAHRDHGPRHQSQHHNHKVVPEWLLVLVAVGGKAFEIVL